MGDCITTYTGKHFDPTHPDEELICIEDIAHALSLLCRGNGHVRTFFSVGQHCILCAKEAEARGYSGRLILASLLHDASECYMSDVPRPFKKSLPEYRKQEEALLNIIYLKYLLNETPDTPKPVVHVPIQYRQYPFSQVEEEYRNLFDQLSAKICK